MLNTSAVLLGLGQLAPLLDDGHFAGYWQRGLALLYEQLPLQAVSLLLVEPVTGPPTQPLRLGEFVEPAASALATWEADFCHRYADSAPSAVVTAAAAPELSSTLQLLHIPLVTESRVRGAMTCSFVHAEVPKPAEQQALCQLVQLFAGNALRALALHGLQRHLARANLLNTIAQAVTSSLDLKRVFHQTTELAAQVVNAQAATLFQIDHDNRELMFLITKGEAAHVLEEKRIPLDHGVVGWTATRGKALVVNQPRDSALFNSAVDSQTGFNTRNILCVPLRIHERTIGVLEVLNKEGEEGFTADDADLLTMMGHQIAIALDNAHLFERQRERVRELATLNKVSQAINSDLDANSVLNAVTQSALEISSGDRCELYLVDHRRQQLNRFATAGHACSPEQSSVYVPLDFGLPGWSIAHNQPLVVRQASLDSRHQPRTDCPELNESSILVVPLSYRGRVVGAITVYSLLGRSFDGEKQEVLQTFANQVAVALQNAELYQSLRTEQERIIKAQEEVRHHLARELHDNTAQMLSLITLNLELSRRMLNERRLDQVQAELDNMQRLARQANREVRTLLFELRPIILESRGLIPALHAYHRQLESSLASVVHLEAPPLPVQISLQAANAIFSIIQEAVNNIRKHAKAAHTWIRVYTRKEQLYFEVEDDGLGCAITTITQEYEQAGSFGLRNMHERANLLGGKLAILSPRPEGGRGTLVRGVAPITRVVELPGAFLPK